MSYNEGGLSASDIALLQNRNSGGFDGTNGGWWIIIFLIFALGGWGNRGFGGYGGGNGGGGSSVYEGYVLSNDFSNLERKIDGVYSGICDSTFALNNTITNGFASAQNTMTQGFAGLNTGMIQQGYESRIATNAVGTQLMNCCCDLRQQIADTSCATQRSIDNVNFNMAQNTCAITNNATLNTRDIIENMNANYKALHDEIVANRMEDLREANRNLRDRNTSLELRASQEAQSREIINTIRPCPIPAYQSCNPWGCNCNQGCGC